MQNQQLLHCGLIPAALSLPASAHPHHDPHELSFPAASACHHIELPDPPSTHHHLESPFPASKRFKSNSLMVSLLASAYPHLEQQVNYHDLTKIAHYMLDWEEKLCTHLGLTAVDTHDIKARQPNNPELQR